MEQLEKLKEFRELGLSEKVLKVLSKKGYESPTPIQRLTIPALLKNDKDIIGQAQTGTGKTAAFSLPIIENFENLEHIQAIVLTPTRELALQVAEEMNSLQGHPRRTRRAGRAERHSDRPGGIRLTPALSTKKGCLAKSQIGRAHV